MESVVAKSIRDPSLVRLMARGTDGTNRLFSRLSEEILSLGADLREHPTTTYVGYHEDRMFAALEIGSQALTLWLQLARSAWKSKDPKRRVEVLDDDYAWSLRFRMKLKSYEDIEYALPLIRHARQVAASMVRRGRSSGTDRRD